MMHAVVHPADIQDRDGGVLVLATMFGLYPFLTKVFADGGYQGEKFRQALANGDASSFDRDRQAIGHRNRLSGVAAAMGR